MIDYDNWGDKPIPVIDVESKPYWTAANEGNLAVQRCEDCGERQFYPRSLCRHCWSDRLTFETVDGTGEVYAKTVCHIPGQAGYEEDTPYNLALVDLNVPENPSGFDIRLLTHVDCPNEDVETGMTVVVRFKHISDDPKVHLPVFRPIDGD